ncbi:MAG: hypothetical protein H6842_11920 [Rhodospirillaceae bacterium]|nr:hypothetical protein [Rhodospirillaceae bacterium]
MTETKADGLRHEFRIVIPAATLEDLITKRLKSLGQQVRLPVFGPARFLCRS